MEPDWKFWKQIPAPALMECVLLSIDVEPNKFQPHWLGMTVLQDRLEIARSNIQAGRLKTAPKCGIPIGGGMERVPVTYADLHNLISGVIPDETPIDLVVFSKWAVAIGWKIPKKMKAMARPTIADAARNLLHKIKKTVTPPSKPDPIDIGAADTEEAPATPHQAGGTDTMPPLVKQSIKRTAKRNERLQSLAERVAGQLIADKKPCKKSHIATELKKLDEFKTMIPETIERNFSVTWKNSPGENKTAEIA